MTRRWANRRPRAGAACALAGAAGALALAGCGGGSGASQAGSAARAPGSAGGAAPGAGTTVTAAASTTPPAPAAPPPPPLRVRMRGHVGRGWGVAARVHGGPAAWIAQRSGVTLMRFDQSLVRLDLHAGSSDGGSEGWRYGDHVEPSEIHHLIAGFNGGFKLTYRDVGFLEGGRVAVALRPGLASIVTYTDGTSDVGAWREGVPSARRRVYSVLQNQHLLVDRGAPVASAAGCITACWGETIGGRTVVARSALAVTAGGQLIWAAGGQLLPSELAAAMAAAGAVRAAELDINPDWVAGYLYEHHPSGPAAVPVVPGQVGIAGQLLEPYSRDFFTIVAR